MSDNVLSYEGGPVGQVLNLLDTNMGNVRVLVVPAGGGDVPSYPAESDAGNITGAANVSVATNLARFFTLTGNAVVTVTGLVAGKSQWFQFRVIQGGAGGFTMSLAGQKTPGALGLVLSTAPGATDIISGFWNGSAIYALVSGNSFA